MLGADYLKCRSAKHTKMIMKCLNPKLGTVYTCSDMTYNRYWFDSVQESFNRHSRQLNQITRWNMESQMLEDGGIRRNPDPMRGKGYDEHVSSLRKAYLSFTDNGFLIELQHNPTSWSKDFLDFKSGFHDTFVSDLNNEDKT